MNRLTTPTPAMTRRTSEWREFPGNIYLDHRHPNWVLAEEFGDVMFVPARGVVLVHRERAEHKHCAAIGRDPEPASSRPSGPRLA